MNQMPSHIGVIPDGNRRWAKIHGLPSLAGHKAGADRMHSVVEALIQRSIQYLTVWGFSTDNWKRSPEEVQSLFQLLQLWIEKDTPWLHENGVRLRHIGRFHELPESLQDVIVMALDLTKDNRGMTLNLAFNYSGRAEIADAVSRLIDERLDDWRSLKYIPQSIIIREAFLSRYLYTDGIPDVDLLIRTAGEFRLSNFMLWQVAYSELYFTEKLWPDFDKEELEKALNTYATRQRRFGGD